MSVCLFLCLSVCLSCMMATTCSRRTGLSDSIRASERVSLTGAVWSALLPVCGTREENGRPCHVESSIHGCGWPVHPDRRQPLHRSPEEGRLPTQTPDRIQKVDTRSGCPMWNRSLVSRSATILCDICKSYSLSESKQIPRTVNTRRQKANGQYHCCILANITENNGA